MPRPKNVTITEIAAQCGVSAQTVSRVVNNRPDVSAATREAVEKAIANSGYQPSAIARGLVRRRSQTLGVIVAGLRDFGVSQILNGIAEQSQAAGYGLLLREIADANAPELAPVVDMLISHQVEGIIFATPSHDWTIRLADEIPKQCPPAIFLKREASPSRTTIGIDNTGGAITAVEHLLALGRTRIAHISGPARWLEARQRVLGWQQTLEKAGLTAHRLVEGNWSSVSGQDAFRLLLERHPDIDAVFASNDQMALGVLREASDRGIRIPDDLAVIGFDGMSEASQFTPSLTTIAQPLTAIGGAAVERLLREIEGDEDAAPGADIVMPTQLIVRESAPAVSRQLSSPGVDPVPLHLRLAMRRALQRDAQQGA